MRKYYRAALAIIASVSLVVLLFYRHEYNKLRYVLEVLNYFGSPAAGGEGRFNCSESSLSKLYYDSLDNYGNHTNFDEPIPSWQRLSDEIYLYSAHRINEDEIRAIGLARSNRTNLTCEIYYENRIDPVAGKLTLEALESSSWERSDSANGKIDIYEGYYFICNYAKVENSGFVAAVKLKIVPDIDDDIETAIILAVRDKKPLKNDEIENEIVGLCVAPSMLRSVTNTDMMNFIIFHSSLGIERFIVYDVGEQPRFNAIMKRILPIDSLSKSKRLSTYSAIPWNFPFARAPIDVVKRVVQADCLCRTRGIVDIIATVTWNEYIVMKYHDNIAKLLRDFEKADYSAERYRISSIDVCFDRTNNKSSADTSTSEYNMTRIIDIKRSIFMYDRSKSDGKSFTDDLVTRDASLDLVAINRYEEQCQSTNEPDIILDDLGKLSRVMKNSSLSKLFRLHARVN